MSENVPQFSVAEFSKAIKLTIENAFGYVKISGEITGFKRASSGHLYFNLKEDNAVLTAVCFRNQANNIDFEIGDGLQICASGKITSYEGRSNYQIIVDKIEIAGIGAILEMIEKRRKKLAEEGLFDAIYKKKLPFFPKIIGVITSETGAVIEDIKHRILNRCPLHLMLYPSAVQGEKASREIIAGIKYFNNLKINRPEVIIIARGGGSF
jgi:exodeoxyribonuclease VII large subunit